ncbi:MAG: hypothetical protein AAB792_02135 [Patescibacteria group bacterium]
MVDLETVDLETMDPVERERLFVSVFRWIQANGGKLPFAAYCERIRTWHGTFVDLAIVRLDQDKISVLLERRPETGHIYPGMYDIPGGNFMYRETAFEAASRLAGKLGFMGIPSFAGIATYTKTEAEIGISLLFVLEIKGQVIEPGGCRFFALNELPQDLVPWQANCYPSMIQSFFATGSSFLSEYSGQ